MFSMFHLPIFTLSSGGHGAGQEASSFLDVFSVDMSPLLN